MDGPTLHNLQQLYFFLDQNFDDLRAKCTTDEQRQQLGNNYVAARDALANARNLVFQEDDPMVKSLNGQLAAAEEQMAGMLGGLQDIVKLLGLFTGAASLAGRLVALGALA